MSTSVRVKGHTNVIRSQIETNAIEKGTKIGQKNPCSEHSTLAVSKVMQDQQGSPRGQFAYKNVLPNLIRRVPDNNLMYCWGSNVMYGSTRVKQHLVLIFQQDTGYLQIQ